jgi:L,D-peptidoglycan transpeptidase YkuD (ErfK/YbiS/YcfS/YnhG family)
MLASCVYASFVVPLYFDMNIFYNQTTLTMRKSYFFFFTALVIGLCSCTCNESYKDLLTYFKSSNALIEGDYNQLLLVVSNDMQSSNAQMYCLERDSASAPWQLIIDKQPVFLGKNGLNTYENRVEGDKTTPLGLYDLSLVFGWPLDIDHFKMPFVEITPDMYWSGKEDSTYNLLVRDTTGIYGKESEHLMDYPELYRYFVVIDYNPECVHGKGSAIFMHCSGTNPYTAGCVAYPEAQLREVLQWLDETKQPKIFIGYKALR